MRILALDIGKKRIGVSISDGLGIAAHGLATIENRGPESTIKEITAIVEEEDVGEIVLGLPKNMDDSMGKMAQYVISFKDNLMGHLTIPITLWDERLTSHYAENLLIEADVSRRKRKEKIDKLSAIIILQDYMDWRMNACQK
ncbi:MAG: Holliday junction resolvase RuvX [Nitrospirae bacterium]|nr:Holliday junction resolvase RuvX [Nitrospirota bacterium]